MTSWPSHLEDPWAWNQSIVPPGVQPSYVGGLLETLSDVGLSVRLFTKQWPTNVGTVMERCGATKEGWPTQCEIVQIYREAEGLIAPIDLVEVFQAVVPWAYFPPATIETARVLIAETWHYEQVQLTWRPAPDSAPNMKWKYGEDLWAGTRGRR